MIGFIGFSQENIQDLIDKGIHSSFKIDNSYQTRHFKNPEYQIINIDSLTYAGNLENLKDIESKENYTFIKCNICDAENVTVDRTTINAFAPFAGGDVNVIRSSKIV